MKPWVGIVTLGAGIALLITSRLERGLVPPWLPRLAAAITALGLGAVAATRGGLLWSVVSIAASIVAIALLLIVIRDNLKG
jgi:hypothetical protein